jgi:two-component system, cell cycle sensor histidine kinase and response regulator CckA
VNAPDSSSRPTGDVLVVDDTLANLKLLADVLEGAGHRVRLANDGELALRSVQARRPDLVLLDIRMPGLDGFEVCRRLQADAATRDIPVIFLSSLTETADKTKAFHLGAVDYLPKPVAPEEVLARVGNHLALSIARARLRTQNLQLLEVNEELKGHRERLEQTVESRTAALRDEVIERRKAEERERHLNRVLRAIRNVNQLIVREKDPTRLIQQACESLVETRDYRAIWMVQTGESGRPTRLGESGWGDGFGPFAAHLLDGHPPACWEAARRSERGLAVFTPARSCRECLLWESYRQDSAVVVPIRHGGRDFGVFGVCLATGLEIDSDEEALLVEVAGDLGFALFAIESERRRDMYARIVASSQEGMALIDRDYVYLEANSTYLGLVGRKDDSVAGRRVPEIVGEEFFKSVKQRLDRCFEGEAVVADVSRDIPGRGLSFTEARYSPCRAPDGSVTAAAVSIRDVTASKRAATALQTSEARYRALFEMSRDALMTLAPPSWRFTSANPASIAMLGARTEEDLVSRAPWEFSPEHQPDGRMSADAAAEMIATAMRTGSHYFEWTHRRFSGESFPASVLLARIEVEGQTILQATVRDETVRRKVEAERERLTMAIEQAAEAVVITDATGTITYVNPAFEEITGYTRVETLGQNPRLLKSGAHDEVFYRALWETISAGRTWRGRFVNRKKDGTLYTEETTVSPVRAATGAITSYVAVKRDITRDLDLEAQFLQSQKMEGIGRLAGGIAHDFNNLLSVILGYAGFAFDGAPEGSALREDLLEIRNAGERAAALTRQLLAFSRKQVLQPELLDLNLVLMNAEKMLRRIIGEDVDLVLVRAPALGLVQADPGQVEQVIMNLAVNARDAMPKGGKLTFETADVELDAEYAARHGGVAPGHYVMMAASDTGTGMDQQTMARVFEPFFTTKELGRGTGLGLSTVFGIVQQSGGSIFVRSEVGQGTTFRVYLPRRDPADTAIATEPSAEPPQSAGTQTVLVVEDEEALRRLTKRALEAAGYTVLAAASGEEALAISERQIGDIHLLLTDVVMPRMSGRSLAEDLALRRPTLKVLYMSGYTDDAIAHHGVLDAGMRFIAKPFTSEALTRRVREVLAGGITGISSR